MNPEDQDRAPADLENKKDNRKSKAVNTIKASDDKVKSSKVGTFSKTLAKKKNEEPLDLSTLEASKIKVIERKHKNRIYMFAVEEDASFFDQLIGESVERPWEKMLEKYYTNDCPNKRLDAIISSLYEDRNPDWVFQLNDTKVEEAPAAADDSAKGKLKAKAAAAKAKMTKVYTEDEKALRKHALDELLKVLLLEDLIVVQEELYWFIYTPFSKLCKEAQEMQIRLDLDFDTWKELYIRAKEDAAKGIIEADAKERAKGITSAIKVAARNVGNDVKEDVGKYLGFIMQNWTEVKVEDYSMSAKFYANKIYDYQGGRKPGSGADDDVADLNSNLCRTFFKNGQRIMITNNVIGKMHVHNYPKPGLKATLKKLLIDKVIADSMVLHDLNCKEENDKYREGLTRRSLSKNWSKLSKMFKTQPYNEIRDYFGEQIALYFAFMGFYMKWLLFPVIFGIISVIVGVADTDPGPDVFDNKFTMVYAVFTGIWSTTFLEFWKRRQNFLAYEWKTWECEDVEVPRPEWIATTVSFNTMTWRLEKSYPDNWQKLQILFHFILVCFLVAIVCFIYVIIFTLKPVLKGAGPGIPIIMGVMNVVVIQIMAAIYTGIATKFNNNENYPTDTKYDDALIIKRYLFKFVNTYAAVLFVGFFKEQALPKIAQSFYGLDPTKIENYSSMHCTGNSCFFELATQLIIVLGISQTISALTQIVIPKIENASVKSKAKKAGDAIKSLDYQSVDETQFTVIQRVKIQQGLSIYQFDEYEVKILQFGFVVMFGPALPIAPIFALIVNLLETRTDAMKIMNEFRRSVPTRAKDIGSWFTILSAVSTLAIVVNAFLIGFQTRQFQTPSLEDYNAYKFCNLENCGFTPNPAVVQSQSPLDYMTIQYNAMTARFIYIVVFEHLVLAAKFILSTAIPDMPASVALGMGREAYQNEKRAAGDDFEETTLTVDDILEIRGNRKMF